MGFLDLAAVLFMVVVDLGYLLMGFCFERVYNTLVLSYQLTDFLFVLFHQSLTLFFISLF